MGNIHHQTRVDGRTRLTHRLVVEKVLGRSLPAGAVVHHANGRPRDNRPCNLVVCQDESYHKLLHARAKALMACGDPNKRACVYCRDWDAVSAMKPMGKTNRHYHKACAAAYQYDRKHGKVVL